MCDFAQNMNDSLSNVRSFVFEFPISQVLGFNLWDSDPSFLQSRGFNLWIYDFQIPDSLVSTCPVSECPSSLSSNFQIPDFRFPDFWISLFDLSFSEFHFHMPNHLLHVLVPFYLTFLSYLFKLPFQVTVVSHICMLPFTFYLTLFVTFLSHFF